uniref:Uncharacterized protein n=1 Tax=Knipowitschia caucasica TaxID=637954 RepID=A0AAV2KVJ8_KNICA
MKELGEGGRRKSSEEELGEGAIGGRARRRSYRRKSSEEKEEELGEGAIGGRARRKRRKSSEKEVWLRPLPLLW